MVAPVESDEEIPEVLEELELPSQVEGFSERRVELVRKAVEEWIHQLIDLGGRNNLLHYRDLKLGTLDLTSADPRALSNLLQNRSVKFRRFFPIRISERMRYAVPALFTTRAARTSRKKDLRHFTSAAVSQLGRTSGEHGSRRRLSCSDQLSCDHWAQRKMSLSYRWSKRWRSIRACFSF